MMGVHPVEWRGPKLEGLTLDLGNLSRLPTDLTVNNRDLFYSSVQEQVGTDSRVVIVPVTDPYHLHGHLGGNALLPLFPGIGGSENHNHIRGESRVGMMVERNVSLSSCSDFVDSENQCLPGEFMVNQIPGGHIHPPPASIAGSELNHVRPPSRGDSWILENNVLLPLLPSMAGPERSRGDLAHLNNVKVKIEKVDPFEVTVPLSLSWRTMSLPTDLTPLETEDIKSFPISLPTNLVPRESEGVNPRHEPVTGPLTIDLSDTESEGSVPCFSSEQNSHESRKPDTEDKEGTGMEDVGLVLCWNREHKSCEFKGLDQKNEVQQSSDPDTTRATLPGPKSSQHGLSHSLEPKIDEVTLLNGRTAPRKCLKRKCAMIDLDSIIDLDEQELDPQTTVIPSLPGVSVRTSEFSAHGSLVKKSESGLLKRQFRSEGKQDFQVQQHGPITDLQVISQNQMEDLAKASDQKLVFDIAHDMDDATMEELMRDDDEDLEPDFMLDDNGHVDQNFVVSTFDTDCDRLVPNSKDDQGEVPSWYLEQPRGNEEPIRQLSSINSQKLTNLGTCCCNGFEQGSGNAMHLLQEPSFLRDLNHQLASSGQSFGQLVSKGGAHNTQLGQLQVENGAPNMSDFGVPLPNDTADAVEALCRFVQASSARGAFQPPRVTCSSMTSQITPSQGAPPQHNDTSGAQKSGLDSIASSVVRIDVGDGGAVTIRQHRKSVVLPKPEPVELDVHGGSSTDPVPIKTEWAESKVMGPAVDSRDRIINALKMFEQGRVQMLQEQVNTDPNGKRVRADLKVACSMRKNAMWQNEHRPIGECPGVKVGDCFTYRIEMAIIGLHRAVQAGIAVVSADYCPYRKPVAGSVVIGVNYTYKDDKDMGETVIYSGQGGLSVDKSGTYQDQKLVRGNLALANSLELGLPVRLIRGHKLQGTNTGILYSYDGLYKVTAMAYGMGVHKNMVYTFHLQRIPGQPPIQPSNVTALLYPTLIVPYPLPLNSHPSLPTSSQIPQSREQAWMEHTTSSQAGTNQPSTSQAHHYGDGGWTGQCSNSNNFSTTGSERQGWMEGYEEKPLLYLLPRSGEQ